MNVKTALKRNWPAAILVLWFLLLVLNFLLCRFQISCGAPVVWIISISQKLFFNHFFPLVPENKFVFLIFVWIPALLIAYAIYVRKYARVEPGGGPAAIISGVILLALYLPVPAAFYSLATTGFLAGRIEFISMFFLFAAVGMLQALASNFFKGLIPRIVSALLCSGAVLVLFPYATGISFFDRPSPALLAAAFAFFSLLIFIEATPCRLVFRGRRRSFDFFYHAKLLVFLLTISMFSVFQAVHPAPHECSGLCEDEDVSIVLDKYRAFTVATSFDAKYLYTGFDYETEIARTPLDEGGEAASDFLEVGRFGTMRFREDPDEKLLYVPILGPYPHNRIVVVDENTFQIVNEIRTPEGRWYRMFDMALDKTGGRVLALLKDGRIAIHERGDEGFSGFYSLNEVIPAKEMTGHRIMRIEVNEKRRVAYVCPYPTMTAPLVFLEFDLEKKEITRTAKFDSHPSVVRVIDGGDKLLVALSLNDKVLMLDAETLETIREYPAGFSTRDISVDEKLGLMAVGNFITGTVNLVDLESGKVLKNWDAGRGVRSVEIDARRGSIYAASLCGAVEMKLPETKGKIKD